MKKSIKRITQKIILLFFSIFFVLLFCEVTIRFIIKDWPFKTTYYLPTNLNEYDQSLRWRFTSKVNSLGLRNREVGPKKEATFRILFLGDSLMGGNTSSGKTFTEVLEHRLNVHSSNRSISYEVINAGVAGYTTYQELEFLKIYGLEMEPDLVILGFVFNDLYYKYLHRPTKNNVLGYEPTARFNHFNTNSFPGIIFARSHLAHEIAKRSKRIWKRIFQKPMFPFELQQSHLVWKDYGWINTQKLIGEMQKLLSDKGASLRVLVFPVRDQVNDQYLRINRQYVLYPQGKIKKIWRL